MTETKQKTIQTLQAKYQAMSPYLNERARRIWTGIEAKTIGRGGITLVYKATGIDHKTIRKGIKESNESVKPETRQRKKGGGRKKLTEKNPNLLKDIEKLIEPTTLGNPESPLRWTSKSTYNLAKELKKLGYKIVQRSTCGLLNFLGYSLQANRKIKEGNNHPDRDKQFHFINDKVQQFHSKKQPAISVDTKKKENLGDFKNNGKEYCKKGVPIKVKTYDFPDKELGKAVPYGVYDILNNKGWVSLGISSDTAEFAVNSIKSWWKKIGKKRFTKAKKILITADCGGSNGYRVKLWKIELQKLANEIGLEIHVCHFPPGTSKWNKIEHKMFSFISKNWRGKPLLDKATIINLISNTTTQKGLKIEAQLDENNYEKGIKISDKELAKVNLIKENFHGEWNYSIKPQNN